MISSFNKFIYRVPLYSISELLTNTANIDNYLRSFFIRDEFQEALYIASPDFFHEVDSFLKDEGFNDKKINKFRLTALKYIIRMTTRATPFGMFSGCGIGTFGSESSTELPDTFPFNPNVRLDMGLLSSFVEYIITDLGLRRTLNYFPNNTMYQVGDSVRYVEYSIAEGNRSYSLSSFEKSEYIDTLLNISHCGASFPDLVNALVCEEITEPEAAEFINELIDSKILVSELDPNLNGEEFDLQVRKILGGKSNIKDENNLDFLNRSKDILDVIDRLTKKIEAGSGATHLETYKEIIHKAGNLNTLFPAKFAIQVDAIIKPEKPVLLDKAILDDIVAGTTAFIKFCTPRSNPTLKDFKKKFSERYDDKFVKVAEVIDPEMGIGYGMVNKDFMEFTPFIDDIPIMSPPSGSTTTLNWDKSKHALLFAKIIDARKEGVQKIILTDKDLSNLETNEKYLPATFNAFVSLSSDEAGKIWSSYGQIGASSAACLLGRFGFMDADIKSLVDEIAEYEESYFPNKIVAEINHLTDYRVGNIMARPKYRPFEICYYSKSNKLESGMISVDDLYMGMIGGELILYSRNLKKQVIPRLSNAHNFNNNPLPLYKLLSDLQDTVQPGYINLAIDIEPLQHLFKFIPRIVYRNNIFYPATWFISTTEINKFFQMEEKQMMDGIRAVLTQNEVPMEFTLTGRQHDMYINLEYDHLFFVFVEEIKALPSFTLQEVFRDKSPDGLFKNNKGELFNEIIIPLKSDYRSVVKTEREIYFDSKIQREFYIGDEWVYLKIYAGIKNSSKILKTAMPIVREILINEMGYCSEWFFLKYTDPEFHLRVRFHLVSKEYYGEVIRIITQVLEPYIANQMISNIISETYNRELERYGGAMIVAAEQIFSLDSELALSCLSMLDEKGIQLKYWLIGLSIIDAYLKAFDIDLQGRYDFVLKRRDNFAREFNGNKVQRRHLTTKFRNNKEVINDYFKNDQIGDENVSIIKRTIATFESHLRIIYQAHYANCETATKMEYLASFIHMSIVRFVTSKNRIHEYAFYALMEQQYRTQLGQLKYHNEFISNI